MRAAPHHVAEAGINPPRPACPPPRRWTGGGASPRSLRRRWSVGEGLGSPAEKAVGDSYKEEQRKKQRTVFNFVS